MVSYLNLVEKWGTAQTEEKTESSYSISFFHASRRLKQFLQPKSTLITHGRAAFKPHGTYSRLKKPR
ncbi:MAG: hypothetical protein A4E45_00654 [Methanosaeta sp. PtaB.Bin039]|nr:MAG: hypothetical protein A4E45_00654 [Methanosaeta sp. PtaB.Bin039]